MPTLKRLIHRGIFFIPGILCMIAGAFGASGRIINVGILLWLLAIGIGLFAVLAERDPSQRRRGLLVLGGATLFLVALALFGVTLGRD